MRCVAPPLVPFNVSGVDPLQPLSLQRLSISLNAQQYVAAAEQPTLGARGDGGVVGAVGRTYAPNGGAAAPVGGGDSMIRASARLAAAEGEARGYTYIVEPPPPTVVRPTEGVAGTTVAVFGYGYEGGCDYRCRFGVLGTVAASYDGHRGAISCHAPDPAAVGVPLQLASVSYNGSAALPLAVSLNGQQYGSLATNFSLVAG